MSDAKRIFLLNIMIPVLIAVVSAFIISGLASRPGYINGIVASIDESKEDALKLASSSIAASVAITALPGDLATPAAESLADLNKGFVVVLCALYFEKFFITISGTIAFQWLIPLACLIYVAGSIADSRHFRRFAWKLACFALALFLVIPVGTKISDLIQDRYGDTIDQTIQSAQDYADLTEESMDEGEEDADEGNGLSGILKGLFESGDKIAGGTSRLMGYLEDLVDHFIEVTAIMIVTSCVIPALVVFGFVWISKMIFVGREK